MLKGLISLLVLVLDLEMLKHPIGKSFVSNLKVDPCFKVKWGSS